MTVTLDDAAADPKQIIADLRRQLDQRTAERDDLKNQLAAAGEQQTATAEVLGVINASPGDLAPVFDAMLEKAMRLCEAAFGMLRSYDGERFNTIAALGVPESYAQFMQHNRELPVTGTGLARLVEGEPFVHTADAVAERGYSGPVWRAMVELGGARAVLAVPLRKDDKLIGAITIYRQEPGPFTDKQIALLQNFAAQAVIAMDNARLITETREALEQQTATAEVLGVINASPGDLAPVFDAILEKAQNLCGAVFGLLFTYDGEHINTAALHNIPDGFAEFLRRGPVRPAPETTLARVIEERKPLQIADVMAEDPYKRGDPFAVSAVTAAGVRTVLSIPLVKDNAVLGVIGVFRQEVRPFTDKQIALLQNFAAQAVIAMENARLITETREALEQQTATAEVLGVINASPGDLVPVFDAILDKAMRLCDASFGHLRTFDGKFFHPAASRGVPNALADFYREPRRLAAPGSPTERLIRGETVIHVPDLVGNEAYRISPGLTAVVELGGAKSYLSAALRKDEALLGYLAVYRGEIRPFTDKQIALLQNFAAQAVIAMENGRLLTETREALEQQTATAEVLQVINSSPGDLKPVFDAMLSKAMRLCDASFGELRVYDGERFRSAALQGVPTAFADYQRNNAWSAQPGSLGTRVLAGQQIVHVLDLKDEATYREGDPYRRALVDLGGARTALVAALGKDDKVLGYIIIYRQEVRAFSDKQAGLLQNFAAQAVIAMENTRLLGDLQQRTAELIARDADNRALIARQLASIEVLKAISASGDDPQPVLDLIVRHARELCNAHAANILEYDGALLHQRAWDGGGLVAVARLRAAFPRPPGRETIPGRVVLSGQTVHVPDVRADPEIFAPGRDTGARSFFSVPLLREGRVIGVLGLTRFEAGEFDGFAITLVQSFAEQAVIALENARLLGELRQRTRDLEETLEYQTATSEVLEVISRSTFDLQPVLEAVLETAVRLCRAQSSEIFRLEDGGYRLAGSHSLEPEYEEIESRKLIRSGPGTIVGRTAIEAKIVHVLDALADPLYEQKDQALRGHYRTMLGVPLMRDETVIGVIALSPPNVEAFSTREIDLLRTFADQAVIAIENTRLLTELRESLEQQQAIAEILQVINRSPGELEPVFEIVLDKAMRLCGAAFGILAVMDGAQARGVAVQGLPPALADWRRKHPVVSAQGTLLTRVLAGEQYVHTLDLKDDDLYRRGEPLRRANVDLGGARTSLYVPLARDRDVLGTIHIYRQEVRPFTEKQIALLQNFAAQAVIAMDNARLLNEIRQRQAELRVTFDNMGDGVAMFDADLNLAAWNMNFQNILDLPDTFLAERPSLEGYIRYFAEHGEYGTIDIDAEVRRLTGSVGTQWTTERTRPDGRVIEVRVNPVPGGGTVLIYSDVTERKRAETEIRSARDAAEKALGELRTTQASLVHAQKMAALGELTAGIAHEIKNPLNFVNNFAGLSIELLDELKETTAPMVAELDDDKRAEVDETVEMLTSNLDKIAEHGKRADGIVKSMLEHSRGVAGERRAVDLNALLEEALNLAYHGARAQDQGFNVTMERDFQRDLPPIELAPQEMTRVFLNLIGNGFYAATKRKQQVAGGFRPVLKVTTRDVNEAVEIRVRDNGIGISPEHRDRLFQPFFTTKPTGEGTGLGLSISYDIVTKQHGGTIEVDSEVGEFTEFTIRLPRHQTATAGRAS